MAKAIPLTDEERAKYQAAYTEFLNKQKAVQAPRPPLPPSLLPPPLVFTGELGGNEADCLRETIAELGHELARLAHQLKVLLEHSRVRAIGGFMRARCHSCNVPHLTFRPCGCPHHSAVALLKRFGVEVEQ